MSTTTRFTSRDLEAFPDPIDGTRYEIIDGELIVSKQPTLEHQYTNLMIAVALQNWTEQTDLGYVFHTPGLILHDEQDVVPDVVWISHERYMQSRRSDNKLHSAPELAVEVLSPGGPNERRDREVKLKLYSRIGVEEYWIADWRTRTMEVYRRVEGELQLVITLSGNVTLTSPLLPGFNMPLRKLWGPASR